jgi:hypothetical protein
MEAPVSSQNLSGVEELLAAPLPDIEKYWSSV